MKRVAAIFLLVLISGAQLRAEQLPIRTYTTADGLARDSIHKIIADPLATYGPLSYSLIGIFK